MKKVIAIIVIIICLFLGLELLQRARYTAKTRGNWFFFGFSPSQCYTDNYVENNFRKNFSQLGCYRGEFKKEKDKPRIVCVGDYLTYGELGSAKQAYPDMLEKALGGEYEVINAGVPANGLANCLGRLSEKIYKAGSVDFSVTPILELQPDVIILLAGMNDIGSVTVKMKPQTKLDRLLSKSLLLTTIKEKFFPPGRDDRQSANYEYEVPSQQERTLFLNKYRTNLKAFVERIQQSSPATRIILVKLFCFKDDELNAELPQNWDTVVYPMCMVANGIIGEISWEMNLESVDVFTDRPKNTLFKNDGAHLTPGGMKVVADKLSALIKE